MTANELMCGDWVLDFDDETVKVASISNEEIRLSQPNGHLYLVSSPKPIPLTEEILVKIGFIKVNSQRYDYGNPNTDCYIKVNPQKGMIHVNGRKANCNLYNHFFVHELQHALRLCGLTDLADNLKLN